jgi:hypothetical protein
VRDKCAFESGRFICRAQWSSLLYTFYGYKRRASAAAGTISTASGFMGEFPARGRSSIKEGNIYESPIRGRAEVRRSGTVASEKRSLKNNQKDLGKEAAYVNYRKYE